MIIYYLYIFIYVIFIRLYYVILYYIYNIYISLSIARFVAGTGMPEPLPGDVIILLGDFNANSASQMVKAGAGTAGTAGLGDTCGGHIQDMT